VESSKIKKVSERKKLLERARESSFPPAAVFGAFSAFVADTFRSAPEAHGETSRDSSLVQISLSEPQHAPAPARSHLELGYSRVLVIGSASSAHPFRRSLSGIAVGPADSIYALGDGEVRIFGPDGDMIRGWKAPDKALCLTVGPDERVYFGMPGRIEIHNAAGMPMGGFAAGEAGRPANVTAIKIYGAEILAADASARYIRRYDRSGHQLGVIGVQGKFRGFMLPNKSLDIDVDSHGVVCATDTGRHRVASWVLDGSAAGYFGKFGQANPEDFVGCCNPVNLAIAPDGSIVTAEKVATRVKVYNPNGKLLALIGPEHFDPRCTHLHLAVDSKGRILVADPVRLEIKVFAKSSGMETAKTYE
jgi:hypothetical protein